MYTIPLAAVPVNDLPVAAPLISTAAPGLLAGAIIALVAAVFVLSRALQGLAAVARSVVGPLFTFIAVLVLVTLVLVTAGFAGVDP
ncbi:MAG: hypothetical protein GEU98_22300 [Pseudonocardiaceae bacterium]|nr:hypothetical protein [Pseudonocardiaceae bacterium]